jgi:ATP-dependent RNA helicase DeaD
MYPNDPFATVPAGLGPTLKAKGFEKLTSVQSAVLAEGLIGRDLRISSQTGSGKTVAVGLVLADDLANAKNQPKSYERNGPARPQVVLIAPTRELAAQLGAELTWLYRPLGKSITVVTGGTNIGLDFRALRNNPQVLVGTPGRLLDHVKRESVDLSGVAAVVLDEADEMLDMGFRDELEGILQTTPPERHTHMVSATFPREVLSLAARYQKDAFTVQGTDPKAANTDITHVAHDVRMGNRLDALINIFLNEPDQRTLVFVRTRLATAEVATDLTASGFKAFPLNGEMGQRERTSTLDAFRAGKVQFLIATDVAARGLDIRDVTRIVHYDLPENPEAFTHRSGRTGRAGDKGTSILFVPPSGRRKVEYITRATKVKFETRPVPSVREIRDAAEERLLSSLLSGESSDKKVDERLLNLATKLLADKDPTDVVAELLGRMNIAGPCEPRHIQAPRNDSRNQHGGQREFGGGNSRYEGRNNQGDSSRGNRDSGRGNGDSSNRAPRNHPPKDDYTAFQVTWGGQQGADPRRMLALVCRRGDVRSNSIGAIRISDHASVVDVRKTEAEAFEKASSRPDDRDPRIKIRPWLEPSKRGGNAGTKAKHSREVATSTTKPAALQASKAGFRAKRSFASKGGYQGKGGYPGKTGYKGHHESPAQ